MNQRETMRIRLLWWTLAVLLLSGATLLTGASTASAQALEGVTNEGDEDMYWADQRHVRVLQRRLFEKDGRLELSLFGGVVPNDPFIQYYPVGMRLGYYIQENIGIELSGSYIGEVFRHDTGIATFVEERYRGESDVLDQQRFRGHVMVLWSPIYGKFAFGNRSIVQFDWNFGGGVGVVGTSSISEDRLGDELTPKPEVALGTGWNFWLSNHFVARLDYRYLIFQKVGNSGATMPSEVSFGFGYFF